MERNYILIAEGRSDLRWVYEHWLSECGHFVRTVSDGPWLLSLAPPSPPDLIILDMEVEGIAALEVCRRLRSCEECAQVPILVIGCSEDAADRLQAQNAGADAFLVKPFGRTELTLQVDALLGDTAFSDPIRLSASMIP